MASALIAQKSCIPTFIRKNEGGAGQAGFRRQGSEVKTQKIFFNRYGSMPCSLLRLIYITKISL